jgi:hypothetical protein
MVDGLPQHGLDRVVQPDDLFSGQRIGSAPRVQSSSKERLVHVDIPQPGNKALVEQERLEHGPPVSQENTQRIRGKSRRKRFWAKITQYDIGVVHQPNPSELALAVKEQPASVREIKGNAQVLRLPQGREQETPAHSEVEENIARIVEAQDDVLAPACQADDRVG